MKDIYLPYGFDFKFQYNTYNNIGKRHRNQFHSQRNILCKVYGKIRKLYNKKDTKYKDFDTFSQWEEYIIQQVSSFENHKDFKHYLQKKKDLCESWLSTCETIVTPIYVCLITMEITVYTSAEVDPLYTIIITTVLLLSILIFLLVRCYKEGRKIVFYRDVIEILERN